MIFFAMAYDHQIAVTLEVSGEQYFSPKDRANRRACRNLEINPVVDDIGPILAVAVSTERVENFSGYGVA